MRARPIFKCFGHFVNGHPPWVTAGSVWIRQVLHPDNWASCVSGLPQYEATKAYMPKDQDELSLQQAELVIVLQQEEGKALHAALLYLLPPPRPGHWGVLHCFPPSVVLRGENERWRTGLVSCQLRHRDHQPHRHRKQRAADEAAAQRDQCLTTALLRDRREETHRLVGGPWVGRPEPEMATNTAVVPFGYKIPLLLCTKSTLKDNHVEWTPERHSAVNVKAILKGLPICGHFTSLEFYSQCSFKVIVCCASFSSCPP